MKSLNRILGNIRKADQLFSLIKNGDKIALGISGGKDSLVMLKAMSIYQKFGTVKFDIFPVILDLGFPGFDSSALSEYCKSLGLKLIVSEEKQVYEILSLHKHNDLLPCSICSKMKKAAINKVANELNCNKVAFAHHGDDAIETLIMNEIYGGKIATFEPKMKLVRADITFIRPLILAREEDIIKCVKEENIPVFKSHCPNDGYTKRQDIKELLNKIYEEYPSSKENFLNMLLKYNLEGTWKDNLLTNIEGSRYSLRPVILKEDILIEYSLNKNLDDYNDEFNHYIVLDKSELPIGLIRARFINNKVQIKNVYFKKPSLMKYRKVLNYFERHYLMEVNPLKVIWMDKVDYSLYKELGYKKENNHLVKTVYVK